METMFMITENRKMNEQHIYSHVVIKIRFKKLEQTCCSSKFVYLSQRENYQKTIYLKYKV